MVTKEEFLYYTKIKAEQHINIMYFIEMSRLTGLSKEKTKYILWNYGDLLKEFTNDTSIN